MICECNNTCAGGTHIMPAIRHVYGNVLRLAIPLTLRSLMKDGDTIVATDSDFIPSSDYPVNVVFGKGKKNYSFAAEMDGNIAVIEEKGKIPVGTYDITVECRDDLGQPYRFKKDTVLQVVDVTAEAGIEPTIEYEAQTWYLDAAIFLATTEISSMSEEIERKLEDVFGDVEYDAENKEIKFYDKNKTHVLGTLDSTPFVVDGTVDDVYIDVGRQVLVVVLNEDAGGRRFSVPLYLVFENYYKKSEVDERVNNKADVLGDGRLPGAEATPVVIDYFYAPSGVGPVIPINPQAGEVVYFVSQKKIRRYYYEDAGQSGGLPAVVYVEETPSRYIVYYNKGDEKFYRYDAGSLSMVEIETGSGDGTVTGVKVGSTTYEPTDGVVDISASIPDVSGFATSSDVETAVAWLVDSAPSTLDTLNELAAALGDDPNFATTISTALGNKVDKESGKSLMTDAERTKLAGIASGAEANVQADWEQTITTADDYIKNKPTLATVATSGSYTDLSNKPTIPDVSNLATKAEVSTKQDTLTFDNAPTANSNNPVKSKGIKQAIDEKLSNVTVNAIPAGSVGIIDDLVTDSDTDALSARMGMELNERLEELEEGGAGGGTSVTIDYNNSTKITTFTWGGPALPRSARPTISYATGAENVVVTVTAATGATITAYVDDVLTPLDANGQITFARGAAGTQTVTKTIRATALESGKAQSLAREVTVNIPAVDAVQTDSPTITAALDDNNNPTRLVVTATGDGTINLSVNGETATGSGTVSITIYCGDTALTGLTATATAQDTGEEVSDPAVLNNISVPAATVPSATPTVTTTETDNDVAIAATGSGEVKLYVDNVEQSGTSLTVNKGAAVQTLSVYATAKEQGKTLSSSEVQSVTVGVKSTLLAGTCASNSPFNVTVGNSTYPATIEQEANQYGSYNWSVDIPTSALPTVSAESVTLVALNNTTGTNIFGGTSESPDTNILTITAIPAAVQAIADSCFRYCSELTAIGIRVNAGLFLGSACLFNTPKLTHLGIDSTRLYCGPTNIKPCNSTTGDTTKGLEVVLSSRVAGSMALASGGGDMFSGCTALQSINLEDTSVTGLAINGTSDSNLFNGCTGLTSISLPSTLTVLGLKTFTGCSSLASIDIGDDESIATQTISASKDARPFDGCGASNLAVHIHSSVAAIKNIRLPDKMKTITIEEGINELYSFSGCSAFASVTLPASLKTIVAFYGCYALTSIVVNRYEPDDAAPITALTYSTPFTGVPNGCAISVPYGAGSAYTSAAGWSGRASNITERAQTT